MALDLVLVGGFILSTMWDETVDSYIRSVDFLSKARNAELEFKKYVKVQETNLKIEENRLNAFLDNLNNKKLLLLKINSDRQDDLNKLEMLLENSLNSIEAYHNHIVKTNNSSSKKMYESKIKEEKIVCDYIIDSLKKGDQIFVKIVSYITEKALSIEEANNFINQYESLVLIG